MGLSYGGYMTNWMLGHHPGVFAAAVSENPVTDLIGEYGGSDIGVTIGTEAVGEENPWEHHRAFLRGSPYTEIHRNESPLLLLQAESDQRCPPDAERAAVRDPPARWAGPSRWSGTLTNHT